MNQGNKHLLCAGLLLAHIVLHDGVAADIAVLVPQALIDPLGRVALLGRRRAVRLQKAINDGCERIELGAGRWLGAPIARWHREGQHLPHGLAMKTKAPRRLALAQALNLAGVANASITLHCEHPSAFLGSFVTSPKKALPRYTLAPPRPDRPAASLGHFLTAAYTQ